MARVAGPVDGWRAVYRRGDVIVPLAWTWDTVFGEPEVECPRCGGAVLLTTRGRWQKHGLSVDELGRVTVDRPVACRRGRCGWAVTIRAGVARDWEG